MPSSAHPRYNPLAGFIDKKRHEFQPRRDAAIQAGRSWIYFTVNILAYFAITLLYVHLNPVVRRALNRVATVFFAGFVVVLIFKAVEILSGR